jgi:Trm5-related predicted tRNA methylase
LPQSIEDSCVGDDRWREKTSIDLDAIGVATTTLADRLHLDLVIPKANKTTVFLAPQDPVFVIDCRDMEVMARERNEAKEEHPADHGFALMPFTVTVCDHGHAK